MIKPMIEHIVPDHVRGIMSIQEECGLSRWSEQGYRDELKRADSIGFGAFLEGVLVGFIVGRVAGDEAEIYNLGVLPDRRREGVGSNLLESFVNACKKRGGKGVWLEVRASNKAAIEFYNRHNFASSSIRKGFYQSPDEDALVMVRHLDTGALGEQTLHP